MTNETIRVGGDGEVTMMSVGMGGAQNYLIVRCFEHDHCVASVIECINGLCSNSFDQSSNCTHLYNPWESLHGMGTCRCQNIRD